MKNITWKALPKFTTNLNLFPTGDQKVETKIIIRITDADIIFLNSHTEKKKDLIGKIFQFDLRNVIHRFSSGHYDPNRWEQFRWRETYDSEAHFVQEMIDEQIEDRITDEYGAISTFHYVGWEEVEEIN